MKLISSRQAFYPSFQLGCEPTAVECTISIVLANGRKYLKTPFAMLDAYGDEDHNRVVDGRGFFATADDVDVYLQHEYPWWKQADPIMAALINARQCDGELVGTGRIADRLGVSSDAIFLLARGHRSYSLKMVRSAVRRLTSLSDSK